MELHPDPLVFQLPEELATQLPQTGSKEREGFIQKAFEFFLAYYSELETPKLERPVISSPHRHLHSTHQTPASTIGRIRPIAKTVPKRRF